MIIWQFRWNCLLVPICWGRPERPARPMCGSHMHKFLSGTEASGGKGDKPNQSPMPKPPFDNPQEWVRWHACWMETPAWWLEVVKVPTPRDLISFAKWVWASFLFPKAKFLREVENDHTTPPSPHCIEWDAFLPQTKGNFASQNYSLRQPKKTLAFTNFGWRKVSQPRPINDANWQCASGNWEKLWSHWPPLLMKISLQMAPPSPWKKIASSRSFKEGGEKLQGATRVQDQNMMQRAHPRGSFQTTPLLGCSRPLVVPSTTMVATTSHPTTPGRQTIFDWVSKPPDKPVEEKSTQLVLQRLCSP